jgi:hypothetical protein
MTISKAEKSRRAAARASAALDHTTDDRSAASPAVHVDRNTSATVWVACKLPKGISIQLFEEGVVDRPTFGGGVKPTKVYMRCGEQVRLRGYAVPFGKLPNFPIIGDFGLTEVDRGFWEKWLSQNSRLDLVTKGLVFACSDQASARARALENEKLFCGLEPLDPAGDPRAKDVVGDEHLSDIQPDTERDKMRRPAA